MSTQTCYRCGEAYEGEYEPQMCCSVSDCGCRGLPSEPPLCDKCDRIIFGGEEECENG